MRTTRTALLLGAASAVLAGCGAVRLPPVPVEAHPADIAALAGTWAGGYSGDDSGRGGSIVFQLTAASDTAAGDVLMIPDGGTRPLVRAPNDIVGRPTAMTPGMTHRRLTIRFVRIVGDSVSGVLDPYEVPGQDGVHRTVFTGRAHGSRIDGTFLTYGARGDAPQTGSWWVTRSPP